MELWIVGGAVAAFFIIRLMWKTHTHPAQVLCRQAANMNWVYSGTEEIDGYKNNKLQRGQYEAVVSFIDGNVRLTRPSHPSAFKDFVELEQWIEQGPDGLRKDFQEASSNTKGTATATGNHAERLNHLTELLEREVLGWPEDQAKAGLELLIATLEGDQQKIDETYLQLTVGQFQTIVGILESTEA